jgi:hypothetical protein
LGTERNPGKSQSACFFLFSGEQVAEVLKWLAIVKADPCSDAAFPWLIDWLRGISNL